MAIINFTEYFESGEHIDYKKAACFASFYHGKSKTTRIVYTCHAVEIDPITNKPVTIEDIQKYCVFLTKALDNKVFSFVIREDAGIKIDWDLNTVGMTRPQALLYLTAFRYPLEYPSYVLAISNSKKKTFLGNFRFFQQCHINACEYKYNDPNKKYAYADGGHSLMAHAIIPPKDRAPISFEDFQINLKNGQKTVLDYWQKNQHKKLDFN